MSPSEEFDLSPAGEAFVEFLELHAAGSEVDFESFCADRAGLADELRVLHRNFRALESRYGMTRATVGSTMSSHRSISALLTRAFGPGVDPEVDLAQESSGSRVFGEISQLGEREERYAEGEEVARGGMGAILKVWDRDLRRTLAMKVLLQKDSKDKSPLRADPRTLGRFLEEAQITGQLEYPGIVPVHELGVDSQGRIYFTMPLIRGRTLSEVFALTRSGDGEWTTIRALGALLRATEAVAYAHSKGVIHRDLKPANVMVGAFGETYVMDWGLAKVIGRTDTRDMRLAFKDVAADDSVHTMRTEDLEAGSESALLTRDGTVMGTPAYLPPEQAQARLDEVGPRSDVYSMGAILYELLTGDAPYLAGEEGRGPYEILEAIEAGPPLPVSSLNPDVPAELVAVCEKAMAYAPRDRYEDMKALSDDLRAYLEGRVVHAFETGAIAELKKWIARNTPLAAAIGVAMLLGFGGLGAVAWLQNARRTEAEELNTSLRIARVDADGQARIAKERADDVLRLSDLKLVTEQEFREAHLWPAHPVNIPAYEEWLATTRALAGRLEQFHSPKLAELTAAADAEGTVPKKPSGVLQRPYKENRRKAFAEMRDEWKEIVEEIEADGDEDDELRGHMEYMERALTAIGGPLPESSTAAFEESERQWELEAIAELVRRLEVLVDAESGTAAKMMERLDLARRTKEETLASPEAARAWDEAIASIADPDECPKYGELEIVAQIGLLPIGRDEQSGLWEFWHLQTGVRPERDEEGELVLTETTGLVFVLLPGGTFWMGAQSTDPDERNYDPGAATNDGPVRSVRLDPFFMSKYEMTQGQWVHFAIRNPAGHAAGKRMMAADVTLRHPVESVSWNTAEQCMRQLGLVLPTEAQWEYAAAGGEEDPLWMFNEMGNFEGVGNLADETLLNTGKGLPGGYIVDPWEDGWGWHAPVGLFRPNPYGLHDLLGNVFEWCLDEYCPQLVVAFRPGDGLHMYFDPERRRCTRGGSLFEYSGMVGVTDRAGEFAEFLADTYGLRPARKLDR